MEEQNQPTLVPGMMIQLSGHAARVLRIVNDGVMVHVGGRDIKIPFEQAERALHSK